MLLHKSGSSKVTKRPKENKLRVTVYYPVKELISYSSGENHREIYPYNIRTEQSNLEHSLGTDLSLRGRSRRTRDVSQVYPALRHVIPYTSQGEEHAPNNEIMETKFKLRI